MKKTAFRLLIGLCNTACVNRALRGLTRARLSRRFIPLYIRRFGVDAAEAEKPVRDYASLNEFFIRRLRPGARPVARGEDEVISPVDGLLAALARVEAGARFAVKGRDYTLAALLGDEAAARRFIGGYCLVLYLSPADYHRIHAPFDFALAERAERGKKSWPVNEAGLRWGEEPLCKNHRKILYTRDGAALVAVGATNVNSIVLHEGERWRRGEELGYFQFGSTVLLLFAQGEFSPLCASGERLRMGQVLGRLRPQGPGPEGGGGAEGIS